MAHNTTMKIIGIDKILDEMKEDLEYPELIVGKLYWVLPKKCKHPQDLVGGKFGKEFWIGKYQQTQKNSYYIRLLDFSDWIASKLGASKKTKTVETTGAIYANNQPVMLLTLPQSKNGHESYIDLLIGEKVYNNVIFEPLKMEWYLAPCV